MRDSIIYLENQRSALILILTQTQIQFELEPPSSLEYFATGAIFFHPSSSSFFFYSLKNTSVCFNLKNIDANHTNDNSANGNNSISASTHTALLTSMPTAACRSMPTGQECQHCWCQQTRTNEEPLSTKPVCKASLLQCGPTITNPCAQPSAH